MCFDFLSFVYFTFVFRQTRANKVQHSMGMLVKRYLLIVHHKDYYYYYCLLSVILQVTLPYVMVLYTWQSPTRAPCARASPVTCLHSGFTYGPPRSVNAL